MAKKDKKDKVEEKKNKGKKTFIFILIACVIAFLLLGFGYIYFEYSRLSYLNLDLQNSWRSYIAYLTDYIPGLNKLSKYEYLEISDPLFIEKEILEVRLKAIKDESQRLDVQKQELQKLLDQISQENEKLVKQKEELERLSKEYNEKLTQFTDYNKRIATLGSWLAKSTPTQIASALVRDEVSVDLLVDTMLTLEPKSAAEIIQAIATINPQKAAVIIAKMGEKETDGNK
jgi:flagellar motility protein MotE (MotC chaperone)